MRTHRKSTPGDARGASPNEKRRQLRGIVDRFLERAFTDCPYERARFKKLCQANCDREVLADWLYGISTLAAGGPIRSSPWEILLGLPESKLKNLSGRVESWADEVERANQSRIVSPALCLQRMHPRLPAEMYGSSRVLAERFTELPELLRCYASVLRDTAAFMRKRFGPRKFVVLQFLLVQLLDYVKANAGTPHYDDIAGMLLAAYHAAGGSQDEKDPVAKSFSSDALQKLHRRHGQKYRIFPTPLSSQHG